MNSNRKSPRHAIIQTICSHCHKFTDIPKMHSIGIRNTKRRASQNTQVDQRPSGSILKGMTHLKNFQEERSLSGIRPSSGRNGFDKAGMLHKRIALDSIFDRYRNIEEKCTSLHQRYHPPHTRTHSLTCRASMSQNQLCLCMYYPHRVNPYLSSSKEANCLSMPCFTPCIAHIVCARHACNTSFVHSYRLHLHASLNLMLQACLPAGTYHMYDATHAIPRSSMAASCFRNRPTSSRAASASCSAAKRLSSCSRACLAASLTASHSRVRQPAEHVQHHMGTDRMSTYDISFEQECFSSRCRFFS